MSQNKITTVALAVGHSLFLSDATAATISVGPSCSLVQAVQSAQGTNNSCTQGDAGADTIVLPSNSTQTLTSGSAVNPNLATGLPFVESTITIQGNNSVLERSPAQGTPSFRLITVFTTTGDLTLNDLTIRNGSPGSTYFGGAIYVDVGSELTLNNVTLRDNTSAGSGGAIFVKGINGPAGSDTRGSASITNSRILSNAASKGGGIEVLGDLELIDSIVSGNTATDGGGVYYRHLGGIGTIGEQRLMITDSTISANSASNRGGGIALIAAQAPRISNTPIGGNNATLGGGIYLTGLRTAYFEDGTINYNTAERGAGVYSNGNIEISRSTLSGNSAVSGTDTNTGVGGAAAAAITGHFSLNGNGNTNPLTGGIIFRSSTISNNYAASSGGAGQVGVGAISLYDSTVSDNRSGNRGGGLICNNITPRGLSENLLPSTSRVRIFRSTLTGNSSPIGGAVFAQSVCIVSARSSILAGNVATSPFVGFNGLFSEIAVTAANEQASFDSLGFNILGDSRVTNEEAFATVASFGVSDTTLTSDGELPTAIEDVLLPLADNDGATLTHMLAENSPAIGAGECFAPQPLDQRGMPRTDPCDSGAVETQSAVEPPEPPPEETCFVVPSQNGKAVVFCL